MKFCPQCHLLLSAADCDGISILVCGSCGGCWFTGNSLDEAIKLHPAALANLDNQYSGVSRFENYAGLTAYCPECRIEPLTDWQAPGVPDPLLDCSKCGGVWIRAGLRAALAEARQPTPPQELAPESEAEAPVEEVATTIEERCETPEIPEIRPEEPVTAESIPAASPGGEKLDFLAANEQYVSDFTHGHLPRIPARKLAIVTCMDARMQVYEILGLKPGDANVIRNAGGIVTEDVLRSLIVSNHLLGTQEFLIINHTDCGLLAIEEESFRDRLTSESGSAAIIPAVFHAFKDLEKNLRTQVLKVRSHPWIPREIKVSGFVYDVRSGRLSEVL